MNSLADQLRSLVGMQPAKALGGMSGQAAQSLTGRGYQVYLQEAKALGQTPLSQQAWMQTQK